MTLHAPYRKDQCRKAIRLSRIVNMRFWLSRKLQPQRGASWAPWFRQMSRERLQFDDNPEWTEEDFARARPINEFPELAAIFAKANPKSTS